MDQNKSGLAVDQSAAHTDQDILRALKQIVEDEVFPEWTNTQDGIEIVIENSKALYRTITLYNCTASYELRENYIKSAFLSYSVTADTYTLAITLGDDSKQYLRFSNAVLGTPQVFDCMETYFLAENPWRHLSHIAIMILSKAESAPEGLNQKEKELVPLLRELSYFSGATELYFEWSFPCLISYAEKHGHKNMVKALNGVKKEKRSYLRAYSLSNTLSHFRYRPLWREIYEKIKNSQREYKDRALVTASPEMRFEYAQTVDRVMHSHGFTGAYPDYVKKDRTHGIISANSYGMSYIIGNEKNAVHRVHCVESYADDQRITVEFLCGTAFLKKGDSGEDADIHYCMFDSKGKTLFTVVRYDDVHTTLEQAAEIAAKRATLKKLTAEQRKAISVTGVPPLFTFLFMFIFAGGAFSILFTLVILVLTVVSALIAGEPVGQMLGDIPWLFTIGFTWVVYGGAMGIITALGERNK